MGRDLIAGDDLAQRIKARLLDAHAEQGRRLLYYLLMPTEIHVFSELPEDDSPQKLAWAVSILISRWVRGAQRLRGPVFAGRYHAHELASRNELTHELRMLAWRPVLARLCLVPIHYPHSSLRDTLGLRGAQGIGTRGLADQFGHGLGEGRQALRDAIRMRPTEAEILEWEIAHGMTLTDVPSKTGSGETQCVDAPAAVLLAAVGNRGLGPALDLLSAWVAWRLRVPAGLDVATLKDSTGARVRALVAGLAVQSRLCSAATVARHFKRARSTLSEQMTATRGNAEAAGLLTTPMRTIVDEFARSRHR